MQNFDEKPPDAPDVKPPEAPDATPPEPPETTPLVTPPEPPEAPDEDQPRHVWLQNQVSRLEVLLAREQQVVAALGRYDRMRVDAVAATYRVWRARLQTFAQRVRALRPHVPRDSREARESMDALEAESSQLVDMLDVLLHAGDPSDRRRTPEMSTFSFPDLVREVADPLPDHLTVLRVAEDAEILTSDREKVGQVLAALLDNAMRFSPEGAECVVGADRVGDRYRFWVSDRGPGVAEHLRERLFEPFVRGEAPDGLTEGLGLGLYMSRGLVTSLGGEISLSTEEGRGSTFTVILPQRRTADRGQEAGNRDETAPSEPASSEPASSEPASSEPAPAEPASSEPAPADGPRSEPAGFESLIDEEARFF